MAAKKAAKKTRTSTRKATGAKPARSGSGTGRRKSSSKRGAAMAAGKHLVIVESPTKAKTINRYVGDDYVVMASVGHVRDLPPRAPKGTKMPVPGVDVENNFEPTYDVLPDKKKTVRELRQAAKSAAEVWFATDLDREGEAIAWHLAEALDVPLENAKRVVFNAITKSEIQHAFANPRLRAGGGDVSPPGARPADPGRTRYHGEPAAGDSPPVGRRDAGGTIVASIGI